jgi:hypothetical protein
MSFKMIDNAGRSWRLGYRENDHNNAILPAPFHPALRDIGRIHGYETLVVLKHEETGMHYARSLRDNRMSRLFPL